MSDFYNEVEEGLRADRYREGFRRGWPILAGIALLLVLAVAAFWGWREYRERGAARASESYQQGLDQAARNNRAGAATAFGQAADAGSPGYRALALMHDAAQRLERNDMAGALAAYDRAADAGGSPMIADAAALQAAFVAMDSGAATADVESRLTPLTEEGRPYRPLAREARAYLMLSSGRAPQARRELVVLSLSEESPESLRTRAQAAIQLIDTGGAPAVAGIAQAARSLPPPPPIATNPLPPALPPVSTQPNAPAGTAP